MTKTNLHIAHPTPPAPATNMTNPALITHNLVAEVFQDAFRRRVGRGPNKISITDLADTLDMNARTIKAWRDGDTLPELMRLMRLCAYFGPAFTSEILSPAGLGGVEMMTPAKVDAQGTATDLAAVVHEYLDRLRDGVFCHRDKVAMAQTVLEASRALGAQGNAMLRGDT